MGWTVDVHELPTDGNAKVIASVPHQGASVTDRLNAFGDGKLTLPAAYDRLNEVLDPLNDVGSLVWFKRDGVATDLAFFAKKSSEDVASGANRSIEFTGPGIGSALAQAIVQPYDDIDGLDWIWGGKNILSNPGFEDSRNIAARYEVWNDGTGGFFTLTVDGQTTGNIDHNEAPLDLEIILELISTVTDCLVEGAGTESEPWQITFVDPAFPIADMTLNDSVTGGSSTIEEATNGEVDPSPWMKVQNVDRGAPPVIARYASNGWEQYTTPKLSGEFSWRVNGLERYAGIQQVVRVTPGMTYQLKASVYTSSATDRFRLVLRTTMEEYLGGSTWPDDVVSAIDTWDETTWVANDLVVPDGVTEAIFRHAYVDTGNPLPHFYDDMEMNEGLAPTSGGDIMDLLLTDAQSRGTLTWLVWTFTDALDSNGDAWGDLALAFRANRGQNLSQVLAGLSKFGIEYRVFWNGTSWELGLYNPYDGSTYTGGAGTDRTTDDSPALILGKGITSGPVQENAPAATVMFAEGKNGLWAVSENATAITNWGRREGFIVDTNIEDLPTLQLLADAQLTDRLLVSGSKFTISAQSDQPYDTIFIGDTLQVTLPTPDFHPNAMLGRDRRQRRVVGVITGIGADGLVEWETDLDRATFGNATAIAEGVRRLLTQFEKQEIEPAGSGIAMGLGGVGPIEVTFLVAAFDAREAIKAVADYICTGTDDHLTIQRAINALPTAGGRIMLSEGTFDCAVGSAASAERIIIPANVTLEGIGSSTVLDLYGDNSGFFQYGIDMATKTTISNLRIDLANNDDDDFVGIHVPTFGSEDVSIRSCLFTGHDAKGSGIFYVSADYDTKILDCAFLDINGTAIELGEGSMVGCGVVGTGAPMVDLWGHYITVTGSVFRGSRALRIGGGDCVVTGNMFDDGPSGIDIIHVDGAANVAISGNSIYSDDGKPCVLFDGASAAAGIVVNGNAIWGTIAFETLSYVDGFSIVGNSIVGAGIIAARNYVATDTWRLSNGVIAGNTIEAWDNAGPAAIDLGIGEGAADGVLYHLTIEGNVLVSSTPSTTPMIGLAVEGASGQSNLIIRGNSLRASGTGQGWGIEVACAPVDNEELLTIHIDGNVLHGTDGIHVLDGTHVTVRGNSLPLADTAGEGGYAAHQIWIEGLNEYVYCSDNDIACGDKTDKTSLGGVLNVEASDGGIVIGNTIVAHEVGGIDTAINVDGPLYVTDNHYIGVGVRWAASKTRLSNGIVVVGSGATIGANPMPVDTSGATAERVLQQVWVVAKEIVETVGVTDTVTDVLT